MFMELLRKLGVIKRKNRWEEKLKNLSDSERLDIIETIVKQEHDPEKMRKKILKVVESRKSKWQKFLEKQKSLPADDDDWYWGPGGYWHRRRWHR